MTPSSLQNYHSLTPTPIPELPPSCQIPSGSSTPPSSSPFSFPSPTHERRHHQPPLLNSHREKGSQLMTVKGGTSQACAACKYQRRRCSADCPLAPYFPPDQPKQFQNAHRLFGVSNIVKILKELEPPQKAEAMRSIIYEANVRDCYPVHGCLGLIFALHLQIQHIQLELDAINAQLSLHRCHHQLSSSEAFWTHNSYNSGSTSNSGVQSALGLEHEYDEISPYFDIMDEDQDYENSELLLKDMDMVQSSISENELKRAAACFTLTSVPAS